MPNSAILKAEIYEKLFPCNIQLSWAFTMVFPTSHCLVVMSVIISRATINSASNVNLYSMINKSLRIFEEQSQNKIMIFKN